MVKFVESCRKLKVFVYRKVFRKQTTTVRAEPATISDSPQQLPLPTQLTHQDYKELQVGSDREPLRVAEPAYAVSFDSSSVAATDSTSDGERTKSSTLLSSRSSLTSPNSNRHTKPPLHQTYSVSSTTSESSCQQRHFSDPASPLPYTRTSSTQISTPNTITTTPNLLHCSAPSSTSALAESIVSVPDTTAMSSPFDIKNCKQEVGEDGAGRRQKLKNRFKQLFTLSSRLNSQTEPPSTLAQDTVPVEPQAGVDGNGKIDASDRCDWETIHAIPDDIFRRLLLNGTDLGRRSNLPDVTITCKTNGSYHKVTMLQLSRDGQKEDYVLRVPAHGTSKLWTEQDEYMMQREVELMIHLHLNTKVPVPEVIDFATYIQKGVGFPYILMRKLPGNTAYDIWLDDVENYDTQDAYFRSDCPSPETETKRVTFLHSLAAIMFELGQLHFDQIGIPIFDMGPSQQPPTIGSSYHWKYGENGHQVTERPAFKTTMNYISSVLDAKWDYVAERSHNFSQDTEWRHDNAHCMYRGIRKMLDIVFALPAFHQENETFTICHPDLDLQNILTDEEGNITGIIDWDGSFVAPRCIGSAALPKFLNRDWFPSSVGGLFCAPHLLKRMDCYRKLYAASLQDHGCPDAHMTFDSAMYAGVMSGLLGICGGGDIFDFTEKFLRSMPSSCLRRVDHVEFLVALGRDWPHAETVLKQELAVFMQHEASLTGPLDLISSQLGNLSQVQSSKDRYSKCKSSGAEQLDHNKTLEISSGA